MTDPVLTFRTELRHAVLRQIAVRRRRLLIGATAAALALVGAGITVAATGWPLGEPAPRHVVEDFESYTPQLGFHPDAAGAQLVAREGEAFALYATATREGTYCLAASAPWLGGKTQKDGGTCVSRQVVAEPIAAGIRLTGPADGERRATLVVAGRVRDAEARTVQFTTIDGKRLERSLGADGFFIATVETDMCPDKDWVSTFVALDSTANEVARAAISLVRVQRLNGTEQRVCGWSVAPHGP